MINTNLTRIAAGVLTLLGPALLAFAGGDGLPVAPKPEESSVPWYPILYTVAFLLVLAMPAFKNAKRTHLD